MGGGEPTRWRPRKEPGPQARRMGFASPAGVCGRACGTRPDNKLARSRPHASANAKKPQSVTYCWALNCFMISRKLHTTARTS